MANKIQKYDKELQSSMKSYIKKLNQEFKKRKLSPRFRLAKNKALFEHYIEYEIESDASKPNHSFNWYSFIDQYNLKIFIELHLQPDKWMQMYWGDNQKTRFLDLKKENLDYIKKTIEQNKRNIGYRIDKGKNKWKYLDN